MTCHPHVASSVLMRAMPYIVVADAFPRRGGSLVCAIGDFPILDRSHRPLAAQASVALDMVSGTRLQRYTCFAVSARPLPLSSVACLHSDASYLHFLNFCLEFYSFCLVPLTNQPVFTFPNSYFPNKVLFYCQKAKIIKILYIIILL